MKTAANVLVSVGEPSGDRAAARVATALFQAGVDEIFGIGGPCLERAGVSLTTRIDNISVLGFADGARRFVHWAQAWADLREQIRARRPAAALLVDAPDFNLPLARVLKAEGIPVILYVGPQVWAWRKSRLALLKDRVDIAALILPFEKELYDQAGVKAQFVGHPILDEPPPCHRQLVRHSLGITSNTPLIALLPGSRPRELERHLPVMTETAERLSTDGIAARLAPGGEGAKTESTDPSLLLPKPFCARDLLAAADGALVASGTATLEAAVLGVPVAAVYRTDGLSYAAARYLLRLPYVALPNWIEGRSIVPEILQHQVTETVLYETAQTLLQPQVAQTQREAFCRITERLGGPGAAERTAALVLERLS